MIFSSQTSQNNIQMDQFTIIVVNPKTETEKRKIEKKITNEIFLIQEKLIKYENIKNINKGKIEKLNYLYNSIDNNINVWKSLEGQSLIQENEIISIQQSNKIRINKLK